MLARVYEMRNELTLFLEAQEKYDLLLYFKSDEFVLVMAYLVDIFESLNKLNLLLQGRETNRITDYGFIRAYIAKLELWYRRAQQGNAASFPNLDTALDEKQIKLDGSSSIEEDMLLCKPLETTSKAEDVFKLVAEFFENNELKWDKLVGVCTDGRETNRITDYGFIRAYIAKLELWYRRAQQGNAASFPNLDTALDEKQIKLDEKYVTKFKRDVNRDAYSKAKGSVTDLYKDQRLVEPEFEANPRIRELSHFFSGEMAPKKKEYRKEVGFSVSKEFGSEGNLVDLKQILQSLNPNKHRHIAIVGQAGSGKTTFVERMVRDVAENNNLCGDRSSLDQTERRYEIIYFVFIRDLLDSESINAKDLLFGNTITDLSKESQQYGYEWIIENQEKVIFFFDGLDQATWSLGGHHPKINHMEKASTATVMYNVITGHLFPRVQKVMSSREHCIAPLTGDLRPQLIYALIGLSPDDVKSLFIALLGDIGQQQWDRVCSTSPAIIPLSSVPVFLIYNAIVQKFNPENPPDTMTGVMLEILDIFLKSPHVRNKQVLHKLKEMAFRAMSEGRVVFTKDELKKFGIDPDSIQDLVIEVPGRTRTSHCLLEGTQQIYFSHQVIEENFAAMFVSEMGVREFEEFVNEFIHQDHWSVVRKFLCGILLNPALAIDWPPQMLQIKDKEAKEEILRRSMNEQLKETYDSTALMELFGALYESNDDELIQSHVHDIDFEKATINPSGMLAISSVMRRSGNLNLLRFSKCNLTTELFDIMMSNLKDSQLKVKKFVLGNRFNAELFASVTKFTESYVDEMVLEDCSGKDEVGIISRSVISKKVLINKIDLSFKMSEQLSIETGIVCSKYNVECLKLWQVDLREIHLRNFLKHVGNGKLKELDVSDNYNLGVAGMAVTGIIVSQCEVEKVGMQGCNLTAEAMKAFKENVRDAKVQIF
uniref:uncharacterized protein LOC120327806 n=1 Tax=Styela clava TaxID=7725 RepID=UPI001939BB03|nr:uncharacterized protein LOC120327806 [Styela clava]